MSFWLVEVYANAAREIPWATGDMDMFVKPDGENSAKVYKALTDFGAPLENLKIDDLTIPIISMDFD